MSTPHLNCQAALSSINSRYRSAVHSHRAFSNRQSESGATTALSIACVLGAVERPKDRLERFFGDTFAAITNANHRVTIMFS